MSQSDQKCIWYTCKCIWYTWNASDIPANVSDIPTNASDIPANVSDIPANASDIRADILVRYTCRYVHQRFTVIPALVIILTSPSFKKEATFT